MEDEDPRQMTTTALLKELMYFNTVRLNILHTTHVIDAARVAAVENEINRRVQP